MTWYCANDAWHEKVVVESWHVMRRIGVTLDGESSNPRLPSNGSADRCFAKRRVVSIPLEDLAELMVVALSSDRGARGHDVPVLDQELAHGTRVVSSRLEGFDIRLAGRRSTSPSGVPPWRSSYVNPVVAKKVRPPPPSQNTRGRRTPRE